MRTSQVYRAVAQDSNRFQLCRTVARGTRASHQDGVRMEESIGNILEKIGAVPIMQAATLDGNKAGVEDPLAA